MAIDSSLGIFCLWSWPKNMNLLIAEKNGWYVMWQAVKDHKDKQTSPSQPKSGRNNIKPAVSVKWVSYPTIVKWKLDRLDIEVGADKIPWIMISLERDAAVTVESTVKKWFHKQSRWHHVKPCGKRPAATSPLVKMSILYFTKCPQLHLLVLCVHTYTQH